MHLFKFSFLFLLTFFSLEAHALFSDSECLLSNYSAKVSHKGKPWGLTDNVLEISKNDCVITFQNEKMKLFKEKWIIDVCREPVHIKMGTEGIEIIKKTKDCIVGDKTPHKFCKLVQELDNTIQDDGLIFADGPRENLSTEHGKVYCSYLLAMSYLRFGSVFNRDTPYKDFIRGRGQTAVPNAIPASTGTSSVGADLK